MPDVAGGVRALGIALTDQATGVIASRERAMVTEHFDLAPLEGDAKLLLVTTIVDDPVYLTGPYVVSPHFKKEPDGSKWDPTPCSATW